MKEIQFGQKSKYRGVVCLGFFDCAHIGHIALINEGKKFGQELFVFTFENDISEFLKSKAGYIYSYQERLTRFEEEKVDGVIFAKFNTDFMNLSKSEFLDLLDQTLEITHIVCGEDYTFGRKAEGNVAFLIEYFKNKNVDVSVMPTVLIDGEKASTTMAKALLMKGEVESLNKLLSVPYRISGTITKGFNNGEKLGFPTANITVPKGQTRIKEGVYAGYAYLQGKKYRAIINAGARPTFDSFEYKIETYIDGKFGKLYGEKITVEFIFKIREVTKFESVEDLQKQLQKDLKQTEKL